MRALGMATLLTLGLVAGCQKLNEERTLLLEAGDVKSVAFDGPRSKQAVTVTVSVSGSPVDAYVIAESDVQATQNSLSSNKAPAQSFGGKQKISGEQTIEASIPAKTSFAIIVGNCSKKSDVKLKIVGK
jgi:hypothetical protein